MSKNVNKLVAIITVGAVLSVPMISNAKNVVYSSDVATGTPIATETPSEKEGFRACYNINNVVLSSSAVDNILNPTKFWSTKTGEVYEAYKGKSINDLVPEGYKFVRWEDTTPDAPEGWFHQVKAILEKDQDYIDKMDFSYSDVKVHGFESTGRDYLSFKVSDKNYKVISATADNDEYGFHYNFMKNNNHEKIDDIRTGVREDYNIPDDYEVFNLGEFLDEFNCDKYTINIVLENRLGKQLHVIKTVDKEETTYKNTYNHGGIIYCGPNDIKMNYVSDVTVGSRIYFYNMPDKVFNTVGIRDASSNRRILKDSYKKGTDSNGCYIEFVKDGGEPDNPHDYTTGLYDGCPLLIADGTGRTYTNTIVYHSPKQQEPETPVEPATKTPEEVVEPATETPAEEQATKTPEEPKPAEQATKTPEETKPAKPSNTSDASNVAVALVGLTLTGAVVVKTKKNA